MVIEELRLEFTPTPTHTHKLDICTECIINLLYQLLFFDERETISEAFYTASALHIPIAIILNLIFYI